MAFKCEICAEHDAKNVWYDGYGNEKYICNDCNAVVSEQFCSTYFAYVFDLLNDYMAEYASRMPELKHSLMLCRLAVLKLVIGCTSFAEKPNCPKVDEWFYFSDKKYEVYCSEMFDDGPLIKCRNVRFIDKKSKKLIQDLTFKFSKNKIGEAKPIVGKDILEILSDEDIGYFASKLWIVIQDNIEDHTEEDLARLLSLM